jgi:hypothetical protein
MIHGLTEKTSDNEITEGAAGGFHGVQGSIPHEPYLHDRFSG